MKIGNEINSETYLNKVRELGRKMKAEAIRAAKNRLVEQGMTRSIEEGRTNRSDPTPVNVDPDDDLLVDDIELLAYEAELDDIRTLFNAATDERPPPEED